MVQGMTSSQQIDGGAGAHAVETAPRRAAAFTLIEMMIVVAIVGILAATAIPNFRRFQLRSKSSEAKMNLGAIRTAEMAAVSEFGLFIPAPASPVSYPGRSAVPFTDTGPPGANFDALGFNPEGTVFFQYSVAVNGTAFTAEAAADIDGDMVPQVWGYLLPDVNGTIATPVLGCSGVYDPTTGLSNLRNTVGPCAAAYGQSEF
jgi:type IV pilus assembly protein PilA